MTDEPAKPGHNQVGGIAADQLQSFVERVERIEEEIAASQTDRKEVYAEAKSSGFDTKILKMVIRERKKDKAQRDEEEALFDIYAHALGLD